MTTDILALDSFAEWRIKLFQIVKKVQKTFVNTYESNNTATGIEGYAVVRHPIDLPNSIREYFLTHFISGLNDLRTILSLENSHTIQVVVGRTSADPTEPDTSFTIPGPFLSSKVGGPS
jgi:hypothetical protein